MLNLKKVLTHILNRLPRYYGDTVSNVNNLRATGFGYTNAATGAPSGSNGMILIFSTGDSIVTQIYIRYYGDAVFVRSGTSSTWNNWKQV